MRLSVTDAAFEGFRIVRRRPSVVLWWTLAWFVSTLVSGLVLVSLAGPAASELMQAATAALEAGEMPEPDPALAAAVAPAMLVLLGWTVVFHAVFLSAVARSVLRPEASAFGYLRLGAAEIAQVGNLLLWTAAVVVAYLVVIMVASVQGAVLATVGGAAAGGFLAFVLMSAALAALAWLVARLSLAGPATTETGKVGLGRSWTLSAGAVRPLLGATLLAFAMAFVVWVLVSMVFAPVAALAGLAETPPDASSVAAWLSPATLLSAALSSVAYALAGAVAGGYGARAYQVLAGAGGRAAAQD